MRQLLPSILCIPVCCAQQQGVHVAWKLSVISTIWGILAYMYTKAAVLATNATSLPMWDPEGYRMVPLPNMVANFRDTPPQVADLVLLLLFSHCCHLYSS